MTHVVEAAPSESIEDFICKQRKQSMWSLFSGQADLVQNVHQLAHIIEDFQRHRVEIEGARPYEQLEVLFRMANSMSKASGLHHRILTMLIPEVENTFGACPTAEEQKQFGSDLFELCMTPFGSTPMTLQQWGEMQKFPEDAEFDQHRSMLEAEGSACAKFVQGRLKELEDRYAKYVVFVWFIHAFMKEAKMGRYMFLSNQTSLQYVAAVNVTNLRWTILGWTATHLIEKGTVRQTSFGLGPAKARRFYDLGTVVMPNFLLKLVELHGIMAEQQMRIQALQQKSLALFVSVAITAGQFAANSTSKALLPEEDQES
eukprot:TRINITY_DN41714_c0_g1_i1.p1 TRINITY_DN41714_c0_g1~~TRINITY_DN41714_c0_g1_i1.p1  ORF type:complete len:315 (-),score=48.87 TRINITY_DN41714_c0_g1_i1:192-1136(-)